MKEVKEVVHVPTRELAKEVLRVAKENGLMANLNLKSLNPYYNYTCFELKQVSDYGVIEFYKKQGYKILTTQEFLSRYKPKFKPIAMKCTQEQFEAVKDKLVGCRFISIDNFNEYPYLVNNNNGCENAIINVCNYRKDMRNRQVFEEWNEKTFLEYCGIEVKDEVNELEQLRKENSELKKQLQAINDQPKIGDVCLFWDKDMNSYLLSVLKNVKLGTEYPYENENGLHYANCIKATDENIQAKINELKND